MQISACFTGYDIIFQKKSIDKLPNKHQQNNKHYINHCSDKNATKDIIVAFKVAIHKRQEIGQQTQGQNFRKRFVVGPISIGKIFERLGATPEQQINNDVTQNRHKRTDDKTNDRNVAFHKNMLCGK